MDKIEINKLISCYTNKQRVYYITDSLLISEYSTILWLTMCGILCVLRKKRTKSKRKFRRSSCSSNCTCRNRSNGSTSSNSSTSNRTSSLSRLNLTNGQSSIHDYVKSVLILPVQWTLGVREKPKFLRFSSVLVSLAAKCRAYIRNRYVNKNAFF